MKKPRLSNLIQDNAETRKIRSSMRKIQAVKITINIDSESLLQLRALADQTGIPYQRLLNKLLKDGLGKTAATESRLEKIEKELERLKNKFAA